MNVGLVAIPILLAKLWSVIPRLFAFPPVRSPAQALERLSIALLVASAVFELVTGVINAQYWYPFKFNFVVAHYYGAIVFVASLALHVIVKTAGGDPRLSRARRAQAAARQPREHEARARGRARSRPTRRRRRSRAAACSPSPARARPTLLVANAGQSIGGPLRELGVPRARRREDFPVNKTASRGRRGRADDRRGLRAQAARRRPRDRR